MTHQTHKSYLRITAIVIASFGPVFFLGSMHSFSEPARFTLDLLSFPPDGNPTFNDPATRFLSALSGGFLFGWGVCIWVLRSLAFDKAPDEVRKSVLAGVLAWFFLDSAGSIASGNISNAFFNIAVLLLATGPLWIPVKNTTKDILS